MKKFYIAQNDIVLPNNEIIKAGETVYREDVQKYADMEYNPDYAKNTLHKFIKESAGHNPNSTALQYLTTKISTKELDDYITKTSIAMKNLGIKENDIVFMLCTSTPEMVSSFYALNNIGAISEWFNYKGLDPEKLKKMIIEYDIKHIVASEVSYGIIKKAIEGTNVEKVIINSIPDSLNSVVEAMYMASMKFAKTLISMDLEINRTKNYLENLLERINIAKEIKAEEKFMQNIDVVADYLLTILVKHVDPNACISDEARLECVKMLIEQKQAYAVLREKQAKLRAFSKKMWEFETKQQKQLLEQRIGFFEDKFIDPRIIRWNDFIKEYYENHDIRTLEEREYEHDKVTLIPHTGGTTRKEAGVRRIAMTDYNINSSAYNTTRVKNKAEFGDKGLQIIPPLVATALSAMHTYRYYNFQTILQPIYNIDKFVNDVLKVKNTIAASAFIEDAMNHKKIKELKEKGKTHKMHTLGHGGSTIAKSADQASFDFFQNSSMVYGLSEYFGAVTYNQPVNGDFKAGSCGREVPGSRVMIVDEEYNDLGYGKDENANYKIGKMLISGPSLMQEYIGVETDFVYIDGVKWLDTGDQGYKDELQRVEFVSRDSKIIRSNDGKIFADNLERIIGEIPEVKDYSVVKMPDVRQKYLPAAFIVLEDEPNKLPSEEKEKLITQIVNAVDAKIKEELDFYYKIKSYIICDEVPKNLAMNKVLFPYLEDAAKEIYEEQNGQVQKINITNKKYKEKSENNLSRKLSK